MAFKVDSNECWFKKKKCFIALAIARPPEIYPFFTPVLRKKNKAKKRKEERKEGRVFLPWLLCFQRLL